MHICQLKRNGGDGMSSRPDGADESPLAATGLADDADVVASLVDAAGVGLVLVGPDSTVEWVNDHAADYFALDTDAAVGMDRAAFLDACVRPRLEAPAGFPDADGDHDGHVLPGEGREERWLRYDSTPITTGQFTGGRLEQYVDVTADRRRSRGDRCRRVVETMDDAAYVVDGEGVVEYANPAAQAQTDRALPSLTGAPLLSVFDGLAAPAATLDPVERAVETVLGPDGDESVTVDHRLETPAGPRTYRFDCARAEGGAVITVRDVSAQRRRDRRYETLVENFPNGAVTLVDDDLRYQVAGGRLFEDIDDAAESTVGARVGDLSAGDREVFVESYRSALEGDPATVETSVGDRTLLLRTLPVYDEDGSVRTAIGMTQDITERQHREEELRWKSRALDEAPVGVAITDPTRPDNPMIYVNRRFCDMTGYDRETVVGRNCRFLQGPATEADATETLRSNIDANRPVSVELRNYRQDGRRFWNHLDVAPVCDESGAVVNFVGFQRDVTDRKERQRELREVNRRLDVALGETGTGIWVLEQDGDSVTPFGPTAELFDLPPETQSLDAYMDRIVAEDRQVVEDALGAMRERDERFDVEFRVEVDGRERWMHSRGTVFADDGEGGPRLVGAVSDVTDRKHRIQELEKRQRVLNELHTATREFYPPESLADITEFLVEFTENAFDVEYVSVKQFDEDTGCLEPAVRAGRDTEREIGTVSPGSGSIWESYRTGETRIATNERGEDVDSDRETTRLLITPVGDFGVLVVVVSAETGFDGADVDLIEVLTANAESAFQRLRSDKVHTALAAELSDKQSRVAELSDIVDSVQAVQRRLAVSESQEALESGVCEELLAMADIDFVWLGRPTGADTDLSAAAWAGDAGGYLDAVLGDATGRGLPAQRAAATCQPFTVDHIPSRVFDDPWAKEAVSHEFKSAYSVPLVYDDVLYGVLTAYSRTESAFGEMYANLFADIASLLVNYSRVLEQRQGGDGQLQTEAEFRIDDATETLQRLAAATDSTIRFDTVAERGDDYLRVLVTVVDGDTARVRDHAASMASVEAAAQFGDDSHSQLSLRLRPPTLESRVSRHGGRLLAAEFTADGTAALVGIPPSVSPRPIIDALTTQYEQIDLVAKRQTQRPSLPSAEEFENILTDRQCEILKTAFYGGYFETPRQVKRQEIADSFGISGPAVYNHLQAAHRSLLGTVFES